MHTAPILHPHRFLLILQLHAFRGRGDLEIVLSTRFLAEAISHQYESKLGHLDWLPVFTKDQAFWELHIGHMKFRMLSEHLPYPTLFFSIPYLRGCPVLLSERLRTRWVDITCQSKTSLRTKRMHNAFLSSKKAAPLSA